MRAGAGGVPGPVLSHLAMPLVLIPLAAALAIWRMSRGWARSRLL
ncbi:MAG: hypothetical protein ACM3ML_36990 [Micromonosporaceae bacterium]